MGKGIRETGSNTRPQTVQEECGRRNRAAEEREGKGGGGKSKERAERTEGTESEEDERGWNGGVREAARKRGEERKGRSGGNEEGDTGTHTHT